MSHHLIFGTGPLGKSAAATLLRAGHDVTLVNRSGNRSGLPTGAKLAQGDASNPDEARRLASGADVVYQCAQPPYHRWSQEFPALQQSILEAAAATKARLVIADNLYMYGPPDAAPLREDHPYSATTKKGKLRAAMARSALEAHRAGKLQVASVRGSNFFGPEDQIMLDLVFKPALLGKPAQMLGRLDQPHSFTYAPDFGRALATVGSSEGGFGRAWHTPSPAPVTQAEFLNLLEAALGHPVKRLVGTAPVLRLMGLFRPEVGEMVEMLYEWQRPFVMDSSDFTRSFGWSATPLPEAIRATLEWARGQVKA